MTHTQAFKTLSPQGEIDANSSIDLDEELRAAIAEGCYRFHVDASGLTYISSAGLGVFVSYLDELHSKKGKIVFSGMNDNVRNVFTLVGLHKILPIVSTEKEAIELLLQ